MSLALATPVRHTIQKNMNALTEAPMRMVKSEESSPAIPTMGTRRTRSASQPRGIAPSP